MTDREKRQIDQLRQRGQSYVGIAKELHLSANTVKSYCQRNRNNTDDLCKNCGALLAQSPGAKPRQFCSNHCRQEWWGNHRDQVQHKDSRTSTCDYCGREFRHHGKRPRKYCSQRCCAADRGG